jgi:hypothetical protein
MTVFVNNGKRAADGAVPVYQIADGGTGETTAGAALTALGGINAADHNGIDHTLTPLFLLNETAHDLLDHVGLTGIPAAMQVSLTASGGAATSHSSGALAFTPKFAILGIHLAPWTNITVVVGTAAADAYTTRSSNNDNWVGSMAQAIIDGQDWTCTSFDSSGVTVSGTNAHNVYMLVVGQ